MTKPKNPNHLTTQGAMRRLFPKEVREMLREEIKRAESKANERDRRAS